MGNIQPPVQLSGDMDKGQQAAFINQNFQNLATFLQSDFLKVISSGIVTVNIPSGYSSGQYSSNISHNLNGFPYILSAVTPPYVSLTTDKYTLSNPAISVVSGSVRWLTYVNIGINYVTFTVDMQTTGATYLVGDWVFTYYMLQKNSG